MTSKRLFRNYAVIFSLLVSGLASPARAAVPAPDFTLPGVDGKPVALRAYRGKRVVLNFWATWCPPCREEIPDLAAFYRRYGDRVAVIGVTRDDPRTVARFVRRFGVNYPVALADFKTLLQYGGVRVVPTTFFIDRKGQVVAMQEGRITAQELEEFVHNGTVGGQ